MGAIELKTGRAYWRRIAILWGMLGAFGLVISAMADDVALGLFGIALMIAPAWLLVRRRALWIARFDRDGATLLSGKRLLWNDLEKVIDVQGVRGGAKWHNHYELVFRGGRARVFDRMLTNAGEVVAALAMLTRGANPITGADLGR